MGLMNEQVEITPLEPVPASPRSHFDTPAVTTHFGTVGLLEERALVSRVEKDARGRITLFHYRRASGVEISVPISSPMQVAVNDLILVKSLTFPDGMVLPVAVRLPSAPHWQPVRDVEAALQRYTGSATRFIRWSGAAGSLLGAAAICGLAAPFTAVGAAAGLALALGLRRRDRRDRRKIDQMLG